MVAFRVHACGRGSSTWCVMAGRSRQREARAAAAASVKPVKDTVVFRSDISPVEVKSPVMRSVDKVREYFSQYGNCEVIFEHHTSVRGLDRHTMVIRFKETAVANKVKQKYNGRVLFDARITTSWLDLRQMRELGMPQQQGWERGREKTALGKGRSSRSSPLHSREDSSSPAAGSKYHSSSSLTSASYSTSGTDTESSVESGHALDSSPSVTKFQGVTRLEQSSRLSPVSTPIPGVSPPRDRSPTSNRTKSSSSPYSRRHSSQERSDSRTGSRSSKDREKDREKDRDSSRQREKVSSPKYSTRLRSKRKLSDTDKSTSQSTSTEGPRNSRPSRRSVPYSKRSRDDSSDSQSSKGDLKSSKTVFDRLGPTKEQADEVEQSEKHSETKSRGKKKSDSSSLLSPERRGGLKTPTSDETSSSKQTSGGSDKEIKTGSEKESTLHATEKGKDSKDSRPSRGSRSRTRSQSGHGKSKSVQKAVTESSVGDKDAKVLQDSTSMDTQEKDRAADVRPLVKPTGESRDKESKADQVVDTSVQEGKQSKEHPREKASKEKDDSHQLLPRNRPSVTEEVDGKEAIPLQQVEQSTTEHTAPTADVVHSDIAGTDQQSQKSAIDYKAMKESVMKEFDEHADILVTSCKILSTQNLTSQQLVESSLETSLMHLAATFMAKFQERAMAAKASEK